MNPGTCWLFAAFLFITLPCAAQSDPLNLDFEQQLGSGKPAHWTTTNPNGNYRLDRKQFVHGKKSLLIGAKNDSLVPHSVYRNLQIPVKADNIELSGYLKTAGIRKGNASFYLWVLDAQGNPLNSIVTYEETLVNGNTNWKKYSHRLPILPAAASIRIGVMLFGPGKLWADSLQLTVDGKAYDPAAKMRDKLSSEPDIQRADAALKSRLSTKQVQRLADLGQLWCFMKYHAIYSSLSSDDCDALLFDNIPALVNADNDAAAEAVYNRLLQGFLPRKTVPAPAPPFLQNPFAAPVPAVKTPADYGDLFSAEHFTKRVRQTLAYILRNAPASPNPFVENSHIGNPIFNPENLYENDGFPNSSVRLLALFRYWGMLQYFSPYHPLLQGAWTQTLIAFIPEMLTAANDQQYCQTFLKLLTIVGDSHAALQDNAALMKMRGRYLLPLYCDFVEGKCVVIKKNMEYGVMPGDIIDQIDGVTVRKLVEKWLPLTPGSNLPARLCALSGRSGFLLHSPRKDGKLTIERGSRKMTIIVHRTENQSLFPDKYSLDKPAFEKKNGIGYINPSKITAQDFDQVRALLQDSQGIVIDLRCYPSARLPYSYGTWFKSSPSAFCRITQIDTRRPGEIVAMPALENGNPTGVHFKGRLVVLVDSHTISQAEFSAMAFQSVPGCKIVGNQTNGADGDISSISLPGQLKTAISGLGVCYPDGTGTQRNGLRIDIPCSPTIAGIRQGRDELMDRAVAVIRNGQ